MSSVDKMAIKGIRSFDNHQNETIQFFSPLTLIVGHNGSGKTTVIECLKYATTGQMPPNSKSGAFIHDPDMCGENEVLAQVKLSFNNTNGERMICTRSLQLTMKKTARSVRTLDGTLTIVKNGERSTLSTRCADLDLQVPISLGVSAAILDFVIFCHQEESTWPLSEPGVLKKRFDEIFEALKYTKALDQIRSVRKDQLVQVKLDTVELGHNKLNKERAERVQAESEGLVGKIDTIRGRTKTLKQQIDDALVEQDRLFTSGQEFERIIAELDRFKHERNITKETLRDLSRNITEFQETDDELEDMQMNFARNVSKQEKLSEVLRGQFTDANSRTRDMRDQINRAMIQEGQHRAEAEQYARQVEKREDVIRSISRQHNIPLYDTSLDNTHVAEFHSKLSQMAKGQATKLERQKHEGRSKEEDIDKNLQQVLRRRSEMESLRTSARASMRACERRTKDLQGQLDKSQASEAGMRQIEEQLQEAENRILAARADLDKKDWDRVIREQNTKLRQIEDRFENMNHEINACNRQADTRAKLGLVQTEMKKKDDTLKAQLASHKLPFRELTKKDLELRSMDSDLRMAMSINEGELEDAEKAHEICGKEVAHLEAQLSFSKQQLKAKRTEEMTLKKEVMEVFNNPEIADEEVSDLERDLEKAHGDYYQAQYAVKFYERATSFAEDKECCQLCHQRFHEEFTLAEFLQLMESKKALVPKHLANAQERIDSLNSDLVSVRRVQPARASLALIDREIPKLETEAQIQQESLKRSVEASERALTRLLELKNRARAIEVLDTAAGNMRRLQKEVAECSKQIASLEGELGTSGSLRSADDMQRDLTSLQEHNRQAKKELAQMISDRDNAKSNITILDGQRRDIQLAQSEASGTLREKQNLEERMTEVQESFAKSEQDVLKAETAILEDQPEIDRLREEFQTLRKLNSDAEEKLQRDLSRFTASQNSLSAIEAEINSYLQRGGPDALKKSRDAVEALQEGMQAMEKRTDEISKEISDTEKRNNDLKGTERNIHDNLRLRKIRNDIRRLESAIVDLESKNAERDRDQYILNSKKLKDRYSRLVTERAGLMGEMTQLDKLLTTKQKELDTEYKDADEVYRKQLIKVRTMEKANEDLDKYGKALDSAIMKYHGLKMSEINKIIDELWKSTYCGTDVDSISIQSEGEAKASNRSYNYRVCMVKGEAELDMRGRCSAGQKVLASIIIRLALAECFGVNCGILALDEPTTNLDRENIESLAKSLANIISVRRSQKNFQLIVITHDEEFLRMMGCSDYCDYYYRVSRNEHQKSIIERQRVSVL